MTAPVDGAHREPESRPLRPSVRAMVIGNSPPALGQLARVLEAGRDIVVERQVAEVNRAVLDVERLRPEVVVIDLPDEACQRVVEQIMGRTPTPILVLVAGKPGAATDHMGGDTDQVGAAKRAGAVEVFPKPDCWSPGSEVELRRLVRLVRGVHVVRRSRGALGYADRRGPGERRGPADAGTGVGSGVAPKTTGVATDGGAARVVAIAASTGGPAALATVLAGLAGVDAPVLVIQHIHGDFVEGLIAWMNRVAALPVRLAAVGERLQRGVAYIGPGDLHLKVGPGLRIALDARPVSRHRPSADQLFLSVAEYSGADGVGVVLTGMGDDGAEGLLAIRRRGGLTIVQDEATSAVFGMPHAALVAGAATRVLPVGEIAAAVIAGTQQSRA